MRHRVPAYPRGVLTTLYSFSGPDGANPNAGLLLGSDGNFYGTIYLAEPRILTR